MVTIDRKKIDTTP